MDYDQTTMPDNYDRGRTLPDGMLDLWLARIADALGGRSVEAIVDLGCGTGRFTSGLAEQFKTSVVGIDPSEKMLAEARAKPASGLVSFVKGAGECLPCSDASAGMIFASMSFHHFRDRTQVARECRRVLRESGVLCIRNSTRENGSPYLSFFPNYQSSLDMLPSAKDIVDAFTLNRFSLISYETVEHKMAENLYELATKAAFRADSTLIRLSEKDFERGMQSIRSAAQGDNSPVMIGIDLFIFAPLMTE